MRLKFSMRFMLSSYQLPGHTSECYPVLTCCCVYAQARTIRRRQQGQKGAAELPISSSAKALD